MSPQRAPTSGCAAGSLCNESCGALESGDCDTERFPRLPLRLGEIAFIAQPCFRGEKGIRLVDTGLPAQHGVDFPAADGGLVQ